MAQNAKNLIGLTGIPLVMVLGNSMLIPVLPTMKAKMDLTSLQTSLLITAFSIAAGIVIPFAGYLSDRFGRKIVIILSLVVYGAGGLLAGLAALWWDDPYSLIMVGRVLQGIGAAGTAPIAMALAGDLFNGASESRALGLMETSNGLGKVLSPIFGSLLALISWYMVFLAFPIICGVVLLLFLFLTKEKKQEKQPIPVKQYLHSIGQVFKQHGKWLIPAFFIGSICLFTLFGVLFYLSDLLEEKYKIDGVIKGGFLAIPLLVMSIAAYVTGLIIKKKLGLMRWFVIVGMFLLSASYVLASFVKGAYPLIGILVIGSAGTGLILPCLNSMIVGAVQKAERGMITSLYSGVRFIGVAIGPPIFTWLLDISRTVMFWSIAGLSLVFGVVAIFLLKPKQAQQQTQAGGEQDQKAAETKGWRQVSELLGIEPATPDEKRKETAVEKYGFDPDELLKRILSGQKEKEKN
ncbi:MFS transporter [Brevibacillus centrosporus]|jgi:ACDE family multidrug resistance protein|uniref:MFS transporter n=1 Tax=Brevibacillus centrosporus TaxID=54910 RepID=UPI000F09C9BB|nr:MFS transporter [Brevibacillus centrosporus]MEC2128185.1 MFS transporter [Brevibacillus centrosporus]MED1951565.1 MFS transporter [Brevibacillus centrosporus]RNB73950.1 MFS transporter [Brevibacillus centrosporus]GED30645.1 putative MFS-type transporter YitG [Brevibacillus centrosporus]